MVEKVIWFEPVTFDGKKFNHAHINEKGVTLGHAEPVQRIGPRELGNPHTFLTWEEFEKLRDAIARIISESRKTTGK